MESESSDSPSASHFEASEAWEVVTAALVSSSSLCACSSSFTLCCKVQQ